MNIKVNKNIGSLLMMGLFGIIIFIITSCENESENPFVKDAFNNGTSERNMIVVISDMHMGADLAYSENKENLKPLEDLLEKIEGSENVKELVIAGDMLDEWFVPATVDTYNGNGQLDFVQRISASNKGVFDAFNRIIQGGKILVTYVPGNHDLTITAENIELTLPGINQARDEVLGLGTYSPEGYPEIAIEHGHRYNFFCAPDPFSNQDIAPGSILPPGYFFTRITALHVIEGLPTGEGVVVPITPNDSVDESQANLYRYWSIWAWAANVFTIEEGFDEKIITTNIDGFTENYSVNDLLPYQTTPGEWIDVNLYKGIQDTWTDRQLQNHVEINIPADHAITFAVDAAETDYQAQIQYFSNPNSFKRIVVFGHSHAATMIASENYHVEKSIYANSGTWIDHNPRGASTTFVVITPQNDETSSETFVKLYNFEDEVITEMASDSLRL
ncbi:MAG: metallophosphoesterase [Candidatus Delongbacteria bacterium]|jgi:UDP-2,3-diacylglucosamine pyrophosphatase LpxH|nr:metallophosphoesterase [Candidatus Delongbacteria bacterium]